MSYTPPTASQLRTPADMERAIAGLADAIKAGHVRNEDQVRAVDDLSREVRAAKEAHAVELVATPQGGKERDFQRFVRADGTLRMRSVDADAAGDDDPYGEGLFDSKAVDEWHYKLQDLLTARAIAGCRKDPSSPHSAVHTPTPKLDKSILAHIRRGPDCVRKAAEAGHVERLFSGASGGGSEWQQTVVLARIDEILKIKAEVANRFEVVEMPTKSITWPYASALPRPYLKGTPTVDNPAFYSASGATPTNTTFTTNGLAVMTQLLDDAMEDAVVATLPWFTMQLGEALRDGEEDAFFNGDTSATHQDTGVGSGAANWNARGRWGTTVSPIDHRKAWIGFRKYALGIGSTAKLDGSSYTAFTGSAGLQLAVEQKLHFGSQNSQNLVYFCSPEHYNKIVKQDTNLISQLSLGALASLLPANKGQVNAVANYQIHRTQWITGDMNASGLYDATTTTKTGALYVDTSRWKIFRRRGALVETAKEIRNGVTSVVATIRETFGTFDTTSPVTVVYAYNLAT